MIATDEAQAHLLFINSLNLDTQFVEIVRVKDRVSSTLKGWQGLTSLICKSDRKNLYEFDIRYAWSDIIYKQHLFDFAWNEELLLDKRLEEETTRTKVVVYLCEETNSLSVKQQINVVPNKFLVGRYWKKITHIYCQLPNTHPFKIPQRSTLNTEKKQEYSTTRWFENLKPKTKPKEFFLAPNPQRKGEGGLRTKGLIKNNCTKNFLSVITVVYNGESYLEQTIQSVINQSCDNLEYIIIDGGSTDSTLDIIRKYEDYIDYWVSEPDLGIYDAMNKGTKLALGTHTLHINADDLLCYPHSLDLELSNDNLAGGVFVFQPEENFVKKRNTKKIDKNYYLNIIGCPIYHPSFIGRKNNRSYFDASYKIIADNITIAQKIQSESLKIIPDIIAIHRGGGVSSENAFIGDREIAKAVLKSKNITVIVSLLQKIAYSFARKLAKKLGIVTLRRKYF